MSDRMIPNDQQNGYLETIGRKSGQPRETEIWYASEGGKIWILSGYHNNKDWVKNFIAYPQVRFRIGTEWFSGTMRFLENDPELDLRARRLLVAKYYGYDLASEAELPNEWSKTATVMVIDVA
jgi:deazaflavin-dependent oxidoreductase (nitroreductase family)